MENKPIDLTPLFDLGKYAIDKIEKNSGFIYTNQVATETLIERIKEMGLSPIEEAAYISNSHKIIKEYSRQNNIVQHAINHLKENNLSVSAETAENSEELFSIFFDKAKHIASDDMQRLWGRILAGELSSPGSVTKQLLHTMSIMEREQARAFSKLCTHTVSFSNKLFMLCNLKKEGTYWNSKNIDLDVVLELEALGLVTFESTEFIYQFNTPIDNLGVRTYRGDILELSINNNKITTIAFGNLSFTKTGLSLYNAIEHFYNSTDATFYVEYFTKRGFTVKQL